MCKFEKMDNLLRFASPSGSRWSSSLRESSRQAVCFILRAEVL